MRASQYGSVCARADSYVSELGRRLFILNPLIECKPFGREWKTKEVELRFISELMKNSRRSDRELAKAVGVARAPEETCAFSLLFFLSGTRRALRTTNTVSQAASGRNEKAEMLNLQSGERRANAYC